MKITLEIHEKNLSKFMQFCVKNNVKHYNDYKSLKTFDDLCRACGTTEAEFEEKYSGLPINIVKFARMEIMTTAINQGWVKDTLNTKQRKWYPYFKISSSGLDFTYSYCCYDYTYAHVGSCLCFESEEKSDYAGKQFLKLWEDFIVGKNIPVKWEW